MIKFNERLKAAMAEANLTQTALAGMVDVSKASMSGYLSGKVNPPEKKKEQIALALGKPYNFFQMEEVNMEIAADGGYRLKVDLAAKLMKKSKEWVMQGLRDGVFPWGYAVKLTNWSYFISSVKFTEYTGIEVPLNEIA